MPQKKWNTFISNIHQQRNRISNSMWETKIFQQLISDFKSSITGSQIRRKDQRIKKTKRNIGAIVWMFSTHTDHSYLRCQCFLLFLDRTKQNEMKRIKQIFQAFTCYLCIIIVEYEYELVNSIRFFFHSKFSFVVNDMLLMVTFKCNLNDLRIFQ